MNSKWCCVHFFLSRCPRKDCCDPTEICIALKAFEFVVFSEKVLRDALSLCQRGWAEGDKCKLIWIWFYWPWLSSGNCGLVACQECRGPLCQFGDCDAQDSLAVFCLRVYTDRLFLMPCGKVQRSLPVQGNLHASQKILGCNLWPLSWRTGEEFLSPDQKTQGSPRYRYNILSNLICNFCNSQGGIGFLLTCPVMVKATVYHITSLTLVRIS